MLDRLSRLILVRHGETEGQSSIRYYGVTDVPLSDAGRRQALEARARIPGETFEAVWSSTLCRAWESARLIAPDRPVRIEFDFREIDFGRWEGLTREEIEAVDPDLFAQWQAGQADFDFPEGETRAAFRNRIGRGLERLRRSGVESALIVAHKGVIRTLLELAAGMTLEGELPSLGGVIHVSRRPCGQWTTGRRASDPAWGEAPVGVPLSRS